MIPEGYVVLASCFDIPSESEVEGGIFEISGYRIRRLTDSSVAGLAFDGQRLAVAGRGAIRNDRPSTLTIYQDSMSQEFNLDLANLHGVTWNNGQVIVVSTVDNKVVWVDPDTGDITREWKPNDVPDSWHINDVVALDDRFYVTGFGKFDAEQGWRLPGIGIANRGSPPPDPPTGIMHDILTGEDVLSEIETPHTPTRVAGGWAVCESLRGKFCIYTDSGEQVTTVTVGGWTRGLVLTDEYAMIGSSRSLIDPDPEKYATASVFRRADWELLRTIDLPARHLYSLLLVPENVANWLTG